MSKQFVSVLSSPFTLRHIAALALIAAAAGATACDKDSPTGPDFPLAFTASILDQANIQYITPLGMMSLGSHVIPTSHSYWYRTSTNAVPVYAPAPGV